MILSPDCEQFFLLWKERMVGMGCDPKKLDRVLLTFSDESEFYQYPRDLAHLRIFLEQQVEGGWPRDLLE